MIKILRANKQQLKEIIKKYTNISNKYYQLLVNKIGLPCLVAHIDTVYPDTIRWSNRIISKNGTLLFSPDGIGGDDRCGVYALLRLIQSGFTSVNYLFTDLEERGGIGAYAACHCDALRHTPYFIELDRQGSNDAVFYQEPSETFRKIILKNDFKIAQGTFSDIAILSEYFRVSSVNLSIGFYNAHMRDKELIDITAMQHSIKRLPKLIKDLGNTKYTLSKEEKLWTLL